MDSWYRLRAAKVRDSIIRRLMNSLDTYEEIFLLEDNQLLMYYKAETDDITKIRLSKTLDLVEEKKHLEKSEVEVISLKGTNRRPACPAPS